MIVQRMLDIELTDDDRRDLGRQVVEALDQIDEAEAEKKAAADDAKGTIDEAKGEISKIRRWLRNGARQDLVDCETVVSMEENRKFLRRLDTGAEVPGSSKALEEDDRQRDLPLSEDGDAGNLEAPEADAAEALDAPADADAQPGDRPFD